jgi:acetylornithine deacetylase
MHFAFSYDEEIGCLGAHSLAERLVGAVPRPQAVIVGEPTMMGVVNAQNAGGGIVATFTGVEAHSSMTHLGVSAIHFAGDFIHWLNELQVELAQRKRTDIDTVPGHTTINVGIVSGGTAGNILARECEVLWGYRELPDRPLAALGEEALKWLKDVLLPKMKAKHPSAGIETVVRSSTVGFSPEGNEDAKALAANWSGSNTVGSVVYGTEAGIFRKTLGVPTVVCGPGDIAQAHQPNEFILANQIDACIGFMNRMVEWAGRD